MTPLASFRRWAGLFSVFCLGPWAISGCGGQGEQEVAGGAVRIAVWGHAGQAAERRELTRLVEAFDAAQEDIEVELTLIPEQTYAAQVQAAFLAGERPDLIEIDGPYLANYAWQGQIVPLQDKLPAGTLADQLPSIRAQGTYRDRVYGVGMYESGLGLFGDRRALTAVRARIPGGPEDAWTSDELGRILQSLAARDPDGAVLDLKLNYRGEWFTYAFLPIMHSAGLSSLEGGPAADGSVARLDAPASIHAMETLQGWVKSGFVDPNLDDAAFVTGRVALAWSGHWNYADYHAALGDHLILLPLPDFGGGPRTGQGSWMWAMTRGGRHEAAARLLAALLAPEAVGTMASANGAIPGTRSALDASRLYGEEGALRLFARQLLDGYAVPRPRTPAYPVVTSAFQEAFQAIRNGSPVKDALARAARLIEEDLRANRNYPARDGDS